MPSDSRRKTLASSSLGRRGSKALANPRRTSHLQLCHISGIPSVTLQSIEENRRNRTKNDDITMVLYLVIQITNTRTQKPITDIILKRTKITLITLSIHAILSNIRIQHLDHTKRNDTDKTQHHSANTSNDLSGTIRLASGAR